MANYPKKFTIRVALRKDEILNAVKEIDGYKNNLDEHLEMTVKELAKDGVRVAQASVPVMTGALRESIHAEQQNRSGWRHIWVVKTDWKYARFVEFGTGVVGNNTYPADGKLMPSWWAYGSHSWTYYDEEAEQFFTTSGRRAAHFMYDAEQYMHNPANIRSAWEATR